MPRGAHRQFAGYLTHATHHDPTKYPWLFWTFWGMTTLLVGTLVVALFHTAAWLVRLWLYAGRVEGAQGRLAGRARARSSTAASTATSGCSTC